MARESRGRGTKQRHPGSPGEEKQSQAGEKAALRPKARGGAKVTEKGGKTQINKIETDEKEDAGKATRGFSRGLR